MRLRSTNSVVWTLCLIVSVLAQPLAVAATAFHAQETIRIPICTMDGLEYVDLNGDPVPSTPAPETCDDCMAACCGFSTAGPTIADVLTTLSETQSSSTVLQQYVGWDLSISRFLVRGPPPLS